MNFITVFLLIAPLFVQGDNLFEIVFKVRVGETAILNCVSNLDDTHTFMFWHLPKTQGVIGPRNSFDNTKYNYDAVTGNLEIRSVTKQDEGVYNCISEGIYRQDIKIRNVVLEIRDEIDDISTVYEKSLLTTIGVLLGVLLILLVVVVYQAIRHRCSKGEKEFDSESGCSRNDIYQSTTTTDTSKIDECYTNAGKTPEEESLVSPKNSSNEQLDQR